MLTNSFDYTFQVVYSHEDNVYVAYLENMPSLSAYADTKEQAIEELKGLIKYCYPAKQQQRNNEIKQLAFA